MLMDVLIILMFDLIFVIILLPYLVMTETFLDIQKSMDGQFWYFIVYFVQFS